VPTVVNRKTGAILCGPNWEFMAGASLTKPIAQRYGVTVVADVHPVILTVAAAVMAYACTLVRRENHEVMKRLTKAIVIVAMGLLACLPVVDGEEVAQWDVFETTFETAKEYGNPFVEIEVDGIFRQGEKQWNVPAFWTGGSKWKLRFAPPALGEYTYHVECTDKSNAELNGKDRSLHVSAYHGDNPLLKHGFVKITAGKGYFEHADGTPFLWLGDTWWKCLCKRLTWEGFQELTADRKAKGFNVVQIICGPYPDENFFQPSLENEGGQPYLAKDMSALNPKYFEFADRRFKHLVDAGMVPAIVGAWGRGDCNSMDAFGPANIKRHWRYVIARYGAYPVTWILAGEIADETKWGQGPWAEIARYVREIDPYKHPLTCHTGNGRRGAAGDICLIDYDMVGGNHDEQKAIAEETLAIVTSACAKKPAMPVLVGETCYEGHMQQGFGTIQRHVFWRNLLSGAAGHTYGSAGVWHAGVDGDHGNWGAWDRQPYDWTTWKEGMNYPGSTQLGIGKKLLEQYPWHRFEAHPEWAPACFAAGIPGGIRIIYRPKKGIYDWSGFTVNDLVPGMPYTAFYFDPATGRRFDQGVVTTPSGSWNTPNVPSPQDWVLVMQAENPGAPVIYPVAKAGQAYSGRLLPKGATFARHSGPEWLTIHADGSVAGTPGEGDAGVNSWIVSVTKGGSPPAFIQLQITVTGSTGILFAENFKHYSGIRNGTQFQSGLNVACNGNVAGWTRTGTNAMHAVDRATPAGESNPPDWAIMIWQDNWITSRAFAANAAGHAYRVNFEASAAVYAGTNPDQATQVGDALLIEVLRADNSVLAKHTQAPGAWTGKMAFTAASFSYTGDGSGNVRLRIGPAGPLTSGRFQGAIDNLIVKDAAGLK